jgi:hypothetical protein
MFSQPKAQAKYEYMRLVHIHMLSLSSIQRGDVGARMGYRACGSWNLLTSDQKPLRYI